MVRWKWVSGEVLDETSTLQGKGRREGKHRLALHGSVVSMKVGIIRYFEGGGLEGLCDLTSMSSNFNEWMIKGTIVS